MDDVLNMYDELALRILVLAAADLPEDCGDYIKTQFVGTTGSRTIVWNLRNIPLLVVAAVVGLMGHIGLVVACWGWWGLGRTVSMSPLELANAIIPRAPGPKTGEQPDPLAQGFSSALASCRTNATARQLEKHLRHMDDEGEMAYGLIPAATTTEEVREGEMLR
ncbi:hypothetical protein N0V85_006429 [Neurospora sp. IMI 360204]|nr:hypothetical protein N0V85_006429 [Neurospora sp. IMI 360204]